MKSSLRSFRSRRIVRGAALALVTAGAFAAAGRAEELRRHCAPPPEQPAAPVASGHEHHNMAVGLAADDAAPDRAPATPASDCDHCSASACATPSSCTAGPAGTTAVRFGFAAPEASSGSPLPSHTPASATSPPPTPPPLGTPIAR